MNTTLSVIVNLELIYYNKHTNYVVILDYLKMFQIRTIWENMMFNYPPLFWIPNYI